MTMTATVFALWVLVAGAPPYSIGTFPDYQRCVEAARGQVESLPAIEGHAVQWQCVPADRR
jgi:hypothetical protein